MREILFKGKRIDNGEWVKGFLVKKIDPLLGVESWFILVQEYDTSCIDKKPTLLESLMTWYKVIPETVSEFTSLYDKNSKKIFEGDILESRASENSEDWKRWLCIYKDGSFCFEREFGKRKKKYEQNLLCEDEINLYGLVVIGNVTDNPELLKEGESK